MVPLPHSADVRSGRLYLRQIAQRLPGHLCRIIAVAIVGLTALPGIAAQRFPVIADQTTADEVRQFITTANEILRSAPGVDVALEPQFLDRATIIKRLQDGTWTIAILSPDVLASGLPPSQTGTAAPITGISKPLQFHSISELVDFQNSSDGQFILDSLGRHEAIGLAFINAGSSRIIMPLEYKSINDLRRANTPVVTSDSDQLLAHDFLLLPRVNKSLPKTITDPREAEKVLVYASGNPVLIKVGAVANSKASLVNWGGHSSYTSPPTFRLTEPLKYNVLVTAANEKQWDKISFSERESLRYAMKVAKNKLDEQAITFSQMVSWAATPPTEEGSDIHRKVQFNWFVRLDANQKFAVSRGDPDLVKYLGLPTNAVDPGSTPKPPTSGSSPPTPPGQVNGEKHGDLGPSVSAHLIYTAAGVKSVDDSGVYFVTNRIDEGADKGWAARFSDARADDLDRSSCGLIPNEVLLSDNAYLKLDDAYITKGRNCLFLLKRLQNDNDKLLIFVHGFANTFSDTIKVANILKEKLKVAVVAMSWPSKGQTTLKSYLYDRESTDLSRDLFRNLFTELTDGRSKPHLLAHSMGNYLIVNLLREGILTDAIDRGSPRVLFQDVISVAPDVSTRFFHDSISHLKQHSNLVTLYAASNDYALGFSEDYNGVTRAGTGGPDRILVDDQIQSIDVVIVEERLSSNGFFTNATRAVVGPDTHSYFYKDKRMLDDLNELIVDGREADQRRRAGLRKRTKGLNQLTYWEIPRGVAP
jgi:hypothetical protein